jgi:hypothetical protein
MSLAALANTALLLANTPSALRFRRALEQPEQTQLAILRSCLQRNAATQFGRRHQFETITTVQQYQQLVPISTYEDYQPSIERIAAGEKNVLTAEPVHRFALTSGSAGPEKWIPYTRSLAAEFRRGIAPWLANLYTALPELRGGPAYWSITPVGPRPPRQSKIPVGFDEDSAYLGGMFKRIAESALAVPGELSRVQEMTAFRHLTLLALLRTRELRLISIWHPSFLTLLLEAAAESWDRLLHDIRHGTTSIPPLPALPPNLTRPLKPDPRRAAELRRCGPHQPSAFWPRLRLISCWTDAHARIPSQLLKEKFPAVMLQGKGLLSTEAFASLPFFEGAATPHPLAIRSHFFELLPNDGPPIPAHAAEPGGIYTLLITTGGGFYRYNTHDCVRITGRLRATPCIEFLGKADLVSDLCGEKLSSLFVAAVLARVTKEFSPTFAMLAPDGNGYTLFIEAPSIPSPLASQLDAALSANPHYAYCRHLGQLEAARIFQIRHDAPGAYLESCRRTGQRLGDIKPAPLHTRSDWNSHFRGQYLAPEPTEMALPR